MPIDVPTDEAVDKILDELEKFVLQPAVVARQARRLRAYIAELREGPPTDELIRMLAEEPMSGETPGVADDWRADSVILTAREYVRETK